MHDVGVDEWQRRAHQGRTVLDRQLRAASELQHETEKRIAETKKAREAARIEAAAAFLPQWDPLALELCERLAGMPPGWSARELQKVQQEDHALVVRIRQIEGEDAYQRREALLGQDGEWKNELAEEEKRWKPLHDDLHRHLALPSFRELIETGYDTPGYTVHWYNPRYYRLWKHADEACEKLGQSPFALVRQLYESVREKHDRQKAKKDEVQVRIQNLQRLVNERDAKISRREELKGPAPLAEARKTVGEWLASSNRRMLAGTLQQAGRADLLNAVVKLDGIEAKSAYFEQILQDDLAEDLQADYDKLGSDISKYGRPKKAGTRFALAALEKRFDDRPARWQRRLDQRRALLARLDDWDDWDDVSYDDWGSGVPWWFFFSGRSDPGYGARFDDVSSWMSSSPGFTYVRRKRAQLDPLDDAAAALANQQVDDGGRDVS